MSAETTIGLDERREAVGALGSQLRRLTEAAVRATADPAALRRLAERAGDLAAELESGQREAGAVPEVDDLAVGLRMYSPVSGPGSAFAPPVAIEPIEGGLRGRCTLGFAHEGPPRFAHGGVSAMILDDVMGWACHRAAGTPAMTVGLELAYARPVPLGVPLSIEAVVVAQEGRSLKVRGAIRADAGPGAPLVEAVADFVAPDRDRLRALFPGLAHLI